MNQQQNPETEFVERLRAELMAIVAERGAAQVAQEAMGATPPRRRRGRRLALGGAVVTASVTAALVVSAGGGDAPAAFAVEPQEGGGVTIQIYSPEDATGLEGALAEAGIRSQVTWLPTGMTCREPRFTPSTVKSSAGGSFGSFGAAGPGEAMTIGVMSPQQMREHWRQHTRGEISDDEFYGSTPNIALDPASFRSDQTVVISGSRGPYAGSPEGGFEMRVGIAEGPVGPCEPISQADGGVLGAMNRAVEAEGAPSPGAE